MHYLITPLHTHIDSGFGATGNAFKDAADKLEAGSGERDSIVLAHLPINYLRRHAIELYLKSAIVIIHRRLQLPYGSEPWRGDPSAFVNGKWMPFKTLHSVKELWTYVQSLFEAHRAFFDSFEKVDWTFHPELQAWIDTIEQRDPRSTFFRYPDPKRPSGDAAKSPMTEVSPEKLMDRLTALDPFQKQFILVMENDDGDVTRGYYFDRDALADFSAILKQAVYEFGGMHAAMRLEICGGS